MRTTTTGLFFVGLLLGVSTDAGRAATTTQAGATCTEVTPVDHTCDPAPSFPADCVDQLGPIGADPVAGTNEGFLHITSPVVDPLLVLSSSNASNGFVFVLNPLHNRLRIIDPASGNSVRRDMRVCYRPSALAQSADGSELYVACHAANTVMVVDTATLTVTEDIQDFDEDGRPLLQEPMGMVVDGNTLWVAVSQANKLGKIDLTTREVVGYVDLPGQDPRALALSPDGRWLVVANFLAGNRSEPNKNFDVSILQPGNPAGDVCLPIIDADPTAINIIDESHPDFMDTSHPEYPTLAECYFFAHTGGGSNDILINPERTDHDLVVVDTQTDQVAFSSNDLPQDLGSFNYGLAFDPGTSRLYLATVHARNEADLDRRPLVNRLSILDLDTATGALSIVAIKDLDAPYLDDCDEGTAEAATPYAVTVAGGQVLIAATGSDRLVVADANGDIVSTIPVGFGPKGVIARAGTAWVYNSTGLTVSEVDLTTGAELDTISTGNNPMPQKQRIGNRLMQSARFSSNGTFACASCHPDGGADGLDWDLGDGVRLTMALHEISETDPYHWDAAKCNLKKILQDGIVNVFKNPAGPSDCEIETMSEFIDNLVRPQTPFRAADDAMSEDARVGLTIIHRGRFKDTDDGTAQCTNTVVDPAAETIYLPKIDDPFRQLFNFNSGGGPFPATVVSETCSTSNCHATPHWESLGMVGPIQAVSFLGVWDRNSTFHDGHTTRVKFVEAMETNRQFHGAPAVNPHDNYTGVVAAHEFNDTHFRHPEYNFDGDPTTHGFKLTDTMTRFMAEEEELQAATVGMTVVLDSDSDGDTEDQQLKAWLEDAANQGKIVLRSVGTMGGSPTSMIWDVPSQTYVDDHGGESTGLQSQQFLQVLMPGDLMVLYGGLLPDQDTTPKPKLKVATRTTNPILCAEGHTEYHANLEVGEVDVAMMLKGTDLVDGSRVLVNGQVTGAPLTGGGPDYPWVLPQAPAEPGPMALQVLSPAGMQSNSVALPVVLPVVPAVEPDDVVGSKPQVVLSWSDQFGVTGPGTRYDVYGGSLADLRAGALSGGSCRTGVALINPAFGDPAVLAPGEGTYYVIRAQNQTGATTWGNPDRDTQIAASANGCPLLF